MEKHSNRWSQSAQITIAAAAWLGLGLQLYLMLVSAPPGELGIRIVHYFSFFTILTNLLVAVGLTFALVLPGQVGSFFRGATAQAGIAVYIAVVGITYSLLLRQLWSPTGAQKVADVLLHDVVPLAYVLYWLVWAPKTALRWRDALGMLAYPLVYMGYTLAHGASTGWYPYPFVDVGMIGWPRALIHGAAFLVVFFAGGLLTVAIGRLVQRSRRSSLAL